jgi:putative spermidine/putrescine transport system permease protein
MSLMITCQLHPARLSDRLSAGEPADAHVELSADPRAVAVLDVASGANQAWKVLLQQQGVINDFLVWIGSVADDGRLVMINNQTGTIIAMTHILLPFMILPLYSVMKTIPPTYVRAAKSWAQTNWTAFWRVYFPQSVPGIGAGCDPRLHPRDRLLHHAGTGGRARAASSSPTGSPTTSPSSLNWGLAAALGSILLVLVLMLYWVYDRIVGIDNVKLGGERTWSALPPYATTGSASGTTASG